MTRQSRRFLIIISIQIVILAAIVLFPESAKQRLFSTFEPVARPDLNMKLTRNDVSEIVREIDRAGLFDRYKWTRAVGVERPREAMLVLADRNFEQYWHFELLLVRAHEAGIGAVILDLRDVAEFVPLRASDGSLRTTDERVQLFAGAAREWLLGLSFTDVALLSFGTGARAALDLIESAAEGTYTAWVDVAGRAADDRWILARHAKVSWPPTLMVTGELERDTREKSAFLSAVGQSGVRTRTYAVPGTSDMLLDERGALDRELEQRVMQLAFDWVTSAAEE